jgi:hypothetical protein
VVSGVSLVIWSVGGARNFTGWLGGGGQVLAIRCLECRLSAGATSVYIVSGVSITSDGGYASGFNSRQKSGSKR